MPDTHTFVFADLAGYTALTEAHGDEQAADAAAEFCGAIRGLLDEHGAEEVKTIGDAMLIRVPEAPQAAGLAERIICEHGTCHRALAVRVGMHTGTAVQRGDDWFGAAVNLAARVADVAGPGEVVCTEATRAAVGPAVPMRERGHAEFKNVSAAVLLYVLALEGRAGPALPVDPICRMAVDPERAVTRRSHDGADYFFCSEDCAAAFDRA